MQICPSPLIDHSTKNGTPYALLDMKIACNRDIRLGKIIITHSRTRI